MGRRSCLGCRPRVIRDLEAGCREAAQRSRKEGTRHQALRHRSTKTASDDGKIELSRCSHSSFQEELVSKITHTWLNKRGCYGDGLGMNSHTPDGNLSAVTHFFNLRPLTDRFRTYCPVTFAMACWVSSIHSPRLSLAVALRFYRSIPNIGCHPSWFRPELAVHTWTGCRLIAGPTYKDLKPIHTHNRTESIKSLIGRSRRAEGREERAAE